MAAPRTPANKRTESIRQCLNHPIRPLIYTTPVLQSGCRVKAAMVRLLVVSRTGVRQEI